MQNISFPEYERTAIKMIKHYCKNKNLSTKHFINDIDYIGSAVEGLIKADLKYDARHNCKLSSFRYRGVVLALLSMKRRKKIIKTVPIHENTQLILNKREDYIKNCKKELVENIFNKTELEENQRNFIELFFFEKKTYKEIGQKYSCSKQNVQQVISRAIHKMKSYAYKQGLTCEF